MTDAPLAQRAADWVLPAMKFAALLLVGLLIRMACVLVPGHNGDVSVMVGWADGMNSVGPGNVYGQITSVYPALLYVLWPLGAVFHGAALDTAVKALSIPFDLVLATFIALVTLRMASRRAAFAAAAIYLLNPAVLLAGPVWGQVDAAGTLVFLGALVASASGRHGLAGALGMLAAMLKPQFGLVLLPVGVVATIAAARERHWGPPVRAAAGVLGVYVLLAVPLGLDPVRYWQQLTGVANFQPFASLYAFNPWGLLMGFETPEHGFALVGLALVAVGLGAAVTPLRRRSDLRALLASGAFVAFAFYFLPTRTHERYLFPAMAVLAPLAVLSGRQLLAYLALAAGFSLSLLYALVVVTPFSLPSAIESILITTPAVWVIGLVLMGAAIAWVGLLWRSVWADARAGGALSPPRG